MTHVEELDRELLQARENFTTLFHASPQFFASFSSTAYLDLGFLEQC
jgi:hypothetical protein